MSKYNRVGLSRLLDAVVCPGQAFSCSFLWVSLIFALFIYFICYLAFLEIESLAVYIRLTANL